MIKSSYEEPTTKKNHKSIIETFKNYLDILGLQLEYQRKLPTNKNIITLKDKYPQFAFITFANDDKDPYYIPKLS